MAFTLLQLGSTPSRLRWRGTTSGGSGGADNRTRAQLLTDTQPGPLREAIRGADTTARWTALTDDMRLNLNAHGITTGLPLTPGSDSAFEWSISGGSNLSFSLGTDGEQAIYDLEFVNSMVR